MTTRHNPLIYWMTGKTGRYAQIALGFTLMFLGRFFFRDELEFVSIVLGAVLVGLGLLNLCLIAPLFGEPTIWGHRIHPEDRASGF